MSLTRGLSWTLVALGVAALLWAAQTGDLSVHVVVIVPVITGTGPWAFVGFLLLIGGLAGLWTSWARDRTNGVRHRADHGEPRQAREPDQGGEAAGRAEPSRRSGGVIFLGPIPIVWGSDRESARSMAWLGLALLLLALVVALFLYLG